jgi:hypothetical protein
MGEAIAMAAEKISACPIEFGDAPPAGDAIHHARTDEITPTATEAAGHADDADGLHRVLPLATIDAHAIGKVQSVGFGAHGNRGDLLAVMRPLPAAPTAKRKAAPDLVLLAIRGSP